MKSDILFLLSRGPKSDIELAAFFGACRLTEVKGLIEELIDTGRVRVRARQTRQVDNIVFWDREYLLRTCTSTAA